LLLLLECECTFVWLFRIHMKARTVVKLVHHDLVMSFLSEVVIEIDWCVFKIFWIWKLIRLFAFLWFTFLHSFLVIDVVDLFEFHDLSEGETCHVCVIGSLVVV